MAEEKKEVSPARETEKDWREKETDGLKKTFNGWRGFFLFLFYTDITIVFLGLASLCPISIPSEIVLLALVISVIGWWFTHCIKIVKAWENATYFWLGKISESLRMPGLHFVPWPFGRIMFIPTYEQRIDPPAQKVITQDNIEIEVNPIIFFRIIDPIKFIIGAANARTMLADIAQTSIRDMCGNKSFNDIRAERDPISVEITNILNKAADGSEAEKDPKKKKGWGIEVTRVKLQEVTPPAGLLQAIEKVFVADREKAAKIITAEGERRKVELEADATKYKKEREAEGNAAQTKLQVEAFGPDGAKILAATMIAGMVQKSDKLIIDPTVAGIPAITGVIEESLKFLKKGGQSTGDKA